MQKFVIAFIALCQVVGVAAQVRYTGQVLDERDIPLIAVNIVLGDDQAFGTTTDAEGRFTLNGLRGGAQRLRMSHVGHVMIDTLITGEQHTDQVFRMRLDVVMMRAAEITALRVGDAPKYAGLDKVNPGSVILSGEMMLLKELSERTGLTMAELVRRAIDDFFARVKR